MSIAESKEEPKKYMSGGGFFGLDSTIGNLLGGLLSDGLIATVKKIFEGDEKEPDEIPLKNTYYTLLNSDTPVNDVDNKIMSLLDAISIRNPKMKYKKADNKATDKKKDITPPTNLTPTNPENPVNSEAQQNDVSSAADSKLPENPNPNEEEDKGPITEAVEKKLDSLKDVGDDIRPAEPVKSAKKTTGGVPTPEINNSPIPAGVPGLPKTMNVADLLKPSDVLGMFIDPKKMKVLAGLIIQNQAGIGNSLVSRIEGIPNYLSKVFESGKIEELVQEGKAKYLNNLKTKKSHIHDVFIAALKQKLIDMVLKDNKSKIDFCQKFNDVFVCKNDAATPEPPTPNTNPNEPAPNENLIANEPANTQVPTDTTQNEPPTSSYEPLPKVSTATTQKEPLPEVDPTTSPDETLPEVSTTPPKNETLHVVAPSKENITLDETVKPQALDDINIEKKLNLNKNEGSKTTDDLPTATNKNNNNNTTRKKNYLIAKEKNNKEERRKNQPPFK